MAKANNDKSAKNREIGGVSEPATREQWSRKLLPLMSWMLVILTAFFFVASAIQLVYLHKEIRSTPQPSLTERSPLLNDARSPELLTPLRRI